MDLTPEIAVAAVLEAGGVDKGARALGVPRDAFRTFCATHGVSKIGLRQPAPIVQNDAVLEQEIRQLRSQVKSLTEGEHTAERVIRRLERAIDVVRPQYRVSPSLPPSSSRTPQEMVLLFSDMHASEVVSLEETRGINEYNWEIMLNRMAGISHGIRSHTEHFGFDISKLNIYLLGDSISGDIHDELAITNDRPSAEAIVQLAVDTVEWLLDLADDFPVIHLAGVPGNHPRKSKAPAAKQAHNNGDWLYYKLVEAYLQGHPNFTFDFPRGSFNVQMICDRYRALLMHGDGIRSSMPGVPWAGISRRVTTLEQQFSKNREPLDYVFLGHFHTSNSLDGIQARTWINGSVKGADEYSLKAFGSGRDASQTLLTFHPRRGHTGSYPLDLQGSQAASEGW